MTVELTKDTAHVDEALALIIQQFKGKPNLANFLTAFVARVQEIENALYDVWQQRMLDNATGARLDGLGSIVGIDRNGDDDATYKIRIRAQIYSNVSRGTADDVIRIAKLLGGGGTNITYSEVYDYPAAFSLELTGVGVNVSVVQSVFDAIENATPAGVSFSMLYAVSQPVDTFTFSATIDTDQADARRGVADNTSSTGGQLAGLMANG